MNGCCHKYLLWTCSPSSLVLTRPSRPRLPAPAPAARREQTGALAAPSAQLCTQTMDAVESREL